MDTGLRRYDKSLVGDGADQRKKGPRGRLGIPIDEADRLDFSDVAGAQRIGPVTPREVLRQEFMALLGLSGRALARELGMPSNRITRIVAGARIVTAETSILLGERFGTSAEFWLNLQMAHEPEMAR